MKGNIQDHRSLDFQRRYQVINITLTISKLEQNCWHIIRPKSNTGYRHSGNNMKISVLMKNENQKGEIEILT
jgi:hypothetical protein